MFQKKFECFRIIEKGGLEVSQSIYEKRGYMNVPRILKAREVLALGLI